MEKTGLSETEIKEAEEKYKATLPEQPRSGKPLNFPDRIYRSERKRPLLIVHLLAIGKEDSDLSKAEPVVAWSISFPSTKTAEHLVEYVVNETWLRENYRDDSDEEELDADSQ